MHRAGVLLLLPFATALILAPIATGDETLPSSLVVVANDDYSAEVDVGGNVSFSWSVVNAGTTPVSLSVVPSISAAEYGLVAEPTSATVPVGAAVTLYANVTVPLSPRAPRAIVEIQVQLPDGRHTHLQASVTATERVQLVDLLTAFLAVGAIIFIGFFGSLVFERTKVPDLIFMIVLGLFLGPILATFFGIVLIPISLLKLAAPYFAAVALIIILFDGGLSLEIRQVVFRAGISLLHSALAWSGSILVIATVTIWVLGYPFWIAILLGTILAGTSGAVVIGVVRGMSIAEDTRTILVLESTVTDVLNIIGALTVIGILLGGGSLSGTVGNLLLAFLVALFLGGVSGILWLRVLGGMQGRPFGFMITIAAVFILYAVTEILGGSGGMAALVFGLVLGNHRQIGSVLGIKGAFRIDESFRQFQSEISFVVRTFFFVFLGYSFTLPFATEWPVRTSIPLFSVLNETFWLVLAAIILMFLGILAVRAGAAAATARLHKESREDRRALAVVMGRGLAAAVLASFPFTIPAFTNPSDPSYLQYHEMMAPFEVPFVTIAFLIILLTVVATSVGVVSVERRRRVPGFVEGAIATQAEAQPRETESEQPKAEESQRN